ncbi:MAG: hypothetical protein ACOCP7_02655 [Desulfohalobiaceae bacterium]
MFFLGLLLGLFLFLPREPLWAWGLAQVDHRLEQVKVSSQDISSTSWSRASFQELRCQGQRLDLAVPNLQIKLGWNPLL